MKFPADELTDRLLGHLRQVLRSLGTEQPETVHAHSRIGDLLDSMGLVEFLALLAEDFGTSVTQVEWAASCRFGTPAELADALLAANLQPRASLDREPSSVQRRALAGLRTGWLGSAAFRLPRTVQSAESLDRLLHRPGGWLERHAGIAKRCVWAEEDPLSAIAEAGRECLERGGLPRSDLGALLVTSEAPPLLVGLAAAVHHRLGLPPHVPALETGGACCGFISALWLAQTLLARGEAILIVAVEAPSRYLQVEPGPAGEAAALFGDAAIACLLSRESPGSDAVPVSDVVIRSDGTASHFVRTELGNPGRLQLRLEGVELATRAVRAMAETVRDLSQRHGGRAADLAGVVMHGGNGRMPALLARQLGLAPERVWSLTPQTGNLGSASLPVAWATRPSWLEGPVAWVAVGAGLTWGGTMTGVR